MGETRAVAANDPVSILKVPAVVGAFLVEQPLYTKCEVRLAERVSTHSRFYPEAVRRTCETCSAVTNWTYRGPRNLGVPLRGPVRRGTDLTLNTHEGGDLVSYKCVQCDKGVFAAWVAVEWPDEEMQHTTTLGGPDGISKSAVGKDAARMVLRKLGQWPPFSILPAPDVASSLERADLQLYKRALMNLSTGYGIGAMAYLRRVVENEVERLLASLQEAATDDGDTSLAEEIAKARQSHNAEERLRLAGEAAPSWLRVGGHNPLKLLYGHFSRGIHELDDDACLAVAGKLQAAFEAVLGGIRHHRQQQADIARALT